MVYGGGGMELDEDFYRRAMTDRNRGDHGPVPWAAELGAREFMGFLKEAYEEHCADECAFCAKNMAD